LNVTVITIGSLAHNDNEQMRKFNHFSFRDEHDEHVSLLGSTCIRDMDCVLGRKEPDNDGCTLRPNRVAFGHPRSKRRCPVIARERWRGAKWAAQTRVAF